MSITIFSILGLELERPTISLFCFGLDPIRCAVTKANIGDKYKQGKSGVVESLQHLLVSENYIKPWSAEHSLVTLLTSCF